MNNDYEFKDDYVIIFLDRKDGSRLEAFIDIEDFDLVMNAPFKWSVNLNKRFKTPYSIGKSKRHANGSRDNYQMHRWILDAPKGFEVDHINHNGLDNRRSNLRLLPIGANNQNQSGARKDSKTQIRGVSWDTKTNKWTARFNLNGTQYVVGYFDDIEVAEREIIKARSKYMPYSYESYISSKINKQHEILSLPTSNETKYYNIQALNN